MNSNDTAKTVAVALGRSPFGKGAEKLAADLDAKPTATLVNTRMEVPSPRNGRPSYRWVDACYVVRPDGTKEYPPVRIREAWSRCASEGWAFKVVSESEYKEKPVTHTPGPWIAVDDGDSFNIQAEVKDGPGHGLFAVAEVAGKAFLTSCGGSPEANAKLIAAAPSLLQVCQAIAARHRGEWDHPALVAMGLLRVDSPNQTYEWLTAALTLATGGAK